MELIFPEKFTNNSIVSFNGHYKRRIVNQLQFIISGEEQFKISVENEDRYFASLIEPKNLDGNSTENVIYGARKEFEALCVVLITNGIQNPEKLTVMRFFATLKYFEEKKTKQQKR